MIKYRVPSSKVSQKPRHGPEEEEEEEEEEESLFRGGGGGLEGTPTSAARFDLGRKKLPDRYEISRKAKIGF